MARLKEMRGEGARKWCGEFASSVHSVASSRCSPAKSGDKSAGGCSSSTDTRALSQQRAAVPGAEDALLVGVSRSGFAADAGLDVALTPADLLEAWRPAGSG